MDRVPVAVLGGEAARERGWALRTQRHAPAPRLATALTVIRHQDNSSVPAALEEGRVRTQLSLRLDPACGPVHL